MMYNPMVIQDGVTARGGFRISWEPPLFNKVGHISMVTDHGRLLFCCFFHRSEHVEGVCASSFEVAFSSANVTVATQQTQQQLCLIAVTFTIQQAEDLHFDHICLIYEFSLWCDRLSTICAQSITCLFVCSKIFFKTNMIPFKLATQTQQKTLVRNRLSYFLFYFISSKRSPLLFSTSVCLRSLACQCWLSNKLMVHLVTL